MLFITYITSDLVNPGYGGGMSSTKTHLKFDTHVLSYKVGRNWGVYVSTMSARPFKLHASSAIEKEAGKKSCLECATNCSNANALLAQDLYNNGVSLRADPDHAVRGHRVHGAGHDKLVW